MTAERDEVRRRTAPPAPAAAAGVFGERLEQAERFVAILADTGISHGLIGPREAPRLWSRHVLNCAVVQEAIPPLGDGQAVVDVGSGAGLPGVALAIARPDLHLHLVEPLARRTAWLTQTVTDLGLTNVTVHTARAEALWGELQAPWVIARAVTGIRQLAEWTLPLLTAGGSLLALKGNRAAAELDENRAVLARLGVVDVGIHEYGGIQYGGDEYGGGRLDEPTTILRLTIGPRVDQRLFRKTAPTSAGSARRRGDRPKRPPAPRRDRPVS